MKNMVALTIALIATILCIGLVSGAGGEIVSQLFPKDVEITYDKVKSETNLTTSDMTGFSGVDYKVIGDKIILNKAGLFNNREIIFKQEQTCLNWKEAECITWEKVTCLNYETRKDSTCLNYENALCTDWEKLEGCDKISKIDGVCISWSTEPKCLEYSTPDCKETSLGYCTNWTKYTKDDFIKQAIRKEIEFVKGVQTARTSQATQDINAIGKVIIK